MKQKLYSYILAFLQYTLMGLLLYLNAKQLQDEVSFGIFFTGLVIGIYAVFNNGLNNFLIISEIKDEARLVTHGLYSYIRHPMYFSVIVISFALIIKKINSTNLFLFTLIIAILFLKAKKEEKLWSEKTPNYKEYIKNTKMMIPFLL